jgi:hypothetical protein
MIATQRNFWPERLMISPTLNVIEVKEERTIFSGAAMRVHAHARNREAIHPRFF